MYTLNMRSESKMQNFYANPATHGLPVGLKDITTGKDGFLSGTEHGIFFVGPFYAVCEP